MSENNSYLTLPPITLPYQRSNELQKLPSFNELNDMILKSPPIIKKRPPPPPPPKQLKVIKHTLEKKQRNKCQSCHSTETPEWRKGPLGPRTLCNACGLIWIKLRKDHK